MFEIKGTQDPNIKRMIIDMDNDGINTIGFKLKKESLYELYSILREIFKDE